MIIQLCGLSGAGKTTLAKSVEARLTLKGFKVEILDGDEYRKTICNNLGFSKEDRFENLRRLAFVAGKLSKHGIVSIICAINPYKEIREEISSLYPHVRTIFIDCPIEVLRKRDTKGLYKKAFLPINHPEKITNLTGVNDPFEKPADPDLYINTADENMKTSTKKMVEFIIKEQMQVIKNISTLPLVRLKAAK